MIKKIPLILILLSSPVYAGNCETIEQQVSDYWDAANKATNRAVYMASQYQRTLDNNFKIAGLKLVEVAEEANSLYSQKLLEYNRCKENKGE